MPGQAIQPSFAAGELDPKLWQRIDLAKVHIGTRTMLNWYVHNSGGASNRPGTAWVGEVISSASLGKLIPFQYSTVQGYMLEFGDLKMRVIKDGGYVLESTKTITNITAASPPVVTSAAHGFSNGDQVYIASVAGMTEVNGRYFTVANVAANTFELSGINASGYTTYSSGGTAARVYTVVSPFALADLATLKYEQSADTMTLTHPGYAPRSLTRSGHASWSFSTITFAPTTAAPTNFTSSSGAGGVTYAITAINDETGEESLALYGTAANRTSTLTWTNVSGCSLYYVYNAQNGIYGFIGRCGTGVTGFTDATITADFSLTPPTARNPFSGTGLYPGTSGYYDGRQFFGGSTNNPQTIYGSASAAFNNMSVSQPTKDNDAITRTLASREVNAIKHIIGLTQMLVFTSGAEWKVSAGSADVITPAQFAARPQSYNGCSDIRPIISNSTALFIPPSRRKVRSLDYDLAADVWTGTDLSLLSAHLFEPSGSNNNQIVTWAYAKDPEAIAWTVRDDGTLVGFTYNAEQQVFAWHRHTTTNGTFEDVACIKEGDETAVYFIVKRTIGGATKRYVERLHTRVFATIADAWFLDCALQYSGSAATTIYGLWHLVGQTVYALADGVPVGPFEVSTLGTISLATAASKVTVGKLIPDPELETLGSEGQDQAGTTVGRKKKVNHITVGLKNSADMGLKCGPSGGQGDPVLYQIKHKDLKNPLAAAASSNPALITDLMHMVNAPSWDWYGRTLIKATQPLPYTVTSVMYDVTAGS